MTSILPYTIEHQLPEHIRGNYPLFVQFIEAYYEWMSLSENPNGVFNEFQDGFDLDGSVDTFVAEFSREYLHKIPPSVLVDRRRLLNHIREFYLTRGTKASFKFLFRILFNEDVDIYYPTDDILRVSDGKWVSNERVIIISNTHNIDISLQEIVQTYREDESLKVARGTIKDVKVINTPYYTGYQCSVSDVIGTFKENELCTIGVDTIERIYPIVTGVEINDAGINYDVGDEIVIDAGSYFIIENPIPESYVIDLVISSHLVSDDIEVYINDILVDPVNYTLDQGTRLSLTTGNIAETCKVILPSHAGIISVVGVGSGGEIETTIIKDTPIGFTEDFTYSLVSSSGTGGDVSLSYGSAVYVPGYYKNDDGHLSSTKKVQDSDYWQDYSYVIKTGVSLDVYKEVVKALLHTSGSKLFGSLFISDSFSLAMAKFEDEFKSKLPPIEHVFWGDETLKRILVVSDNLHNKEKFYDDYKHMFDDSSYPVTTMDDLVIADFIANTAPSNLNTADETTFFYFGSEVQDIYKSAFNLTRQVDYINGDKTYLLDQTIINNFINSF